jgi:Baseplate J-like protein
MKIETPKIDKRTFKDLLGQSQALAPFYTPNWAAGQQREPGQALLNIYLHMQEQILSRLNRVPDKNLVAFLDMMGLKLLSAKSAQAAVTFELASGTAEHVLVAKGTLLSGAAADGEVIFQTATDLLVTPAILQETFSYDVGNDSIYQHILDDKEPVPFTVFDGANQQERSLYLGHPDLFNQKKPTTIKVEFLLSEPASDGSALDFVWEYFDGDRWAAITRNAADGTSRFTTSGAMILDKTHTAEIAETEIAGNKNRWIRCRLTGKLQGSASMQLPEINTILISVNPLEPFAPDLAFNNDIPLNLETISVQMIEIPASLGFAARSPDPTLPVRNIVIADDPGNVLRVGDYLKLQHIFDGVEIREIQAINGNRITVSDALVFDYNKPNDPPSALSLYTALRPGVNQVQVESLDGLDVSAPSKVTLFHRGKREIADLTFIASDKSTLTLTRAPDPSAPVYLKGDVIRITPKIKPFGELPVIFDTFYFASDEAFSKADAKITLNIETEWNDASTLYTPPPNPILSWEYWNGKSWNGIRVNDKTEKFKTSEKVVFICPDDIEKVEVNNEEKYWIRVRIVDGDYGREIRIVPQNTGTAVDIKAGKIHFPIISDLTITYENVQEQPKQCLTLNNLDSEDHTDDCIDENKTFAPFKVLPEQVSSLFLGFDKALAGGPLSILFDVVEQFLGQDDRLRMLWFYWDGGGWAQLTTADETENLTKIGLLEFLIANDFAARKLFGKELFWLKGSVVEGKHPNPLQIKGLYPNTTYARQADVAINEIAGSSNGTARQRFTLQHPLVINQEVFVREPVMPTDDEQESIRKEEGKEAIRERKNEFGETIEILIKWHEVDDFDDSDSKSRHYTIDQRIGAIEFGDGDRGLVPPVGADSIIVSYTFGGGKRGNVPVNAISGLKSAVPFVKAVANPLAADGGSETETLDSVLVRGPLLLKTRDRAVMPEDFEALAKNASRKVARAKCLPAADEDRNVVPGWVTVLIVPDGTDARPVPSQLLIKVVKEALEKNSANVVSFPQHIHVAGPDYTEVVVDAVVVPTSLEHAAAVERAVKEDLNRYIHPLTGGPCGTGWEFGREICLSDIVARIERIENVDHVERTSLRANGRSSESAVQLDKYALPVSAAHKITISLGSSQTSDDPCKAAKSD